MRVPFSKRAQLLTGNLRLITFILLTIDTQLSIEYHHPEIA